MGRRRRRRRRLGRCMKEFKNKTVSAAVFVLYVMWCDVQLGQSRARKVSDTSFRPWFHKNNSLQCITGPGNNKKKRPKVHPSPCWWVMLFKYSMVPHSRHFYFFLTWIYTVYADKCLNNFLSNTIRLDNWLLTQKQSFTALGRLERRRIVFMRNCNKRFSNNLQNEGAEKLKLIKRMTHPWNKTTKTTCCSVLLCSYF